VSNNNKFNNISSHDNDVDKTLTKESNCNVNLVSKTFEFS